MDTLLTKWNCMKHINVGACKVYFREENNKIVVHGSSEEGLKEIG